MESFLAFNFPLLRVTSGNYSKLSFAHSLLPNSFDQNRVNRDHFLDAKIALKLVKEGKKIKKRECTTKLEAHSR